MRRWLTSVGASVALVVMGMACASVASIPRAPGMAVSDSEAAALIGGVCVVDDAATQGCNCDLSFTPVSAFHGGDYAVYNCGGCNNGICSMPACECYVAR